MMIERLDFEEFVKAIEIIISEKLGCLYDVRTINVIKNNGLSLWGLCIRLANNSVAPTIYLNNYFNDYKNERDFNEIVRDILDVYKKSNKDIPSISNDFSWGSIQKNVVLRLVNYDMNKEVLESVPHKIVFEDLAVTFHVLTGSTKDGIQSYRISNKLFDGLEITIEDLFKSALTNTMTYFNTSIRNINEVISSMIAAEGMDNEEYAELFDSTVPEEGRGMMYVLSNNIGVYGATTLLYPDIIKDFAETMEADIYILPSSIHEVILVLDYRQENNKEKLKDMVYDINRQVLSTDEILSDSIYIYRRASGKIEKL